MNSVRTNRPFIPPMSDVRWKVLFLLSAYLLLGLTFLGFSRKPLHVLLLIATGVLLDFGLNYFIKEKLVFPLSAMISCCSLAILLNWSYDFHYLFLPVFICIASKYILTYKGKHFFNPSLFAICICILFGGEYITLSPSYQWYGSAQSAWVMGIFVITGAIMLFVLKIKRNWLIGSFLVVFLIQTVIRSIVMKHIIPFETLFIGSMTSPAFYLFTFYMITDPSTSPKDKRSQILVGSSIALLDLFFHFKFSYYTFFFAGLTVAGVRFLYFHLRDIWQGQYQLPTLNLRKYAFLLLFGTPALMSFVLGVKFNSSFVEKANFSLEKIPAEHSQLIGHQGNTLDKTDPRIHHVAKWILSVGDAVSVADVDLDGLPDLFLTQPLKEKSDQAKLYLNQGDFRFQKIAIPAIEGRLESYQKNGVPGFSYFLDYDNDGDKDLFVGVGFGKSFLLQNQIIPTGQLNFEEVPVPFLLEENTVCLSANSLDFNNDGKLDILLTNTLHQYLPDYNQKTPLNIFDLPEEEFDGDRRMYHFLHESWHNANNGGKNYLLLGNQKENAFDVVEEKTSHLSQTRWSLATGTLDMNNDGYTDIFIANDFGRDDWYLNDKGKSFIHQEGLFYGDYGLDTYKGMNASVGDLDGNLQEDIYVSNVHHAMQAEGSQLWMNNTKDQATTIDFVDQAQQFNLLNTGRFGWGGAIGDLDMNGWLDVVQVNGMVDDIWDQKWEEAQDFWYYQAQIARTGPEIHSYADKWADIRGCYIYPNEKDRISLNFGDKYLKDATEALDFDHQANTRGAALVDLDNDGDLDILITNQFGDPFLYKNNLTEKSWIGLELIGNGKNTNKDAVGSKVWLSYQQNGETFTQYKEQRLVNGFMAMGDARMLFALPKDISPNEVFIQIQWHNGEKQNLKIDEINQYISIQQP